VLGTNRTPAWNTGGKKAEGLGEKICQGLVETRGFKKGHATGGSLVGVVMTRKGRHTG